MAFSFLFLNVTLSLQQGKDRLAMTKEEAIQIIQVFWTFMCQPT